MHIFRVIFLSSLVLIIGSLTPALAATPAKDPSLGTQDLIAHGSPAMYWIARVEREIPPGTVAGSPASSSALMRTYIQARKIDDKDWTMIGRFNARVISLADRGSQLAALFENGDWKLLWAGGETSGTSPVDGAQLTMLASNAAGDLWGIASAGVALQSPTTMGATQPAATMPAAMRLLYRLNQDGWTMVTALPDEARPEWAQADGISLCISGTQPALAVLNDGVARIFLWNTEQSKWDSAGQFNASPGAMRIKLLTDLNQLEVWTGSDTDGGAIFVRRDSGEWSGPTALAVPVASVPETSPRDVAVAGQSIRLIVASENSKLNEFTFSATGAARGNNILPQPQVLPVMRPYDWGSATIAALLTVFLFNSLRARRMADAEDAEITVLNLAPLGRRFIAGAIDALPVIGTMVMVIVKYGITTISEMSANGEPPPGLVPYYISVGIYLLHTLVSEELWGWTIGKRLCGLRVVGIDGMRASGGAIFVRNLLRAIDVAMLFLPAGLVLFTPLRQRLGDMAADTIVVDDQAIPVNDPDAADGKDSSRSSSRADQDEGKRSG